MSALDIDTKEGMLLKKQPKGSSDARPTAKQRKSFSNASKSEESAVPEGFIMVQSATSQPAQRRTVAISDKAPETWAMLLRTSNRTKLQPSALVKLRILLRDESAAWIYEWVRFGGFRGWLERIKELCEVEWREECRDDALLFESVVSLVSVICERCAH